MYYDYTPVYNPFEEDFELTVSSPALNVGEKYIVKAKDIILLPDPVARGVVSTISREILRKAGKEFNDPSRFKIEEGLLSRKYAIKLLSEETVQEKPIKGATKKKIEKED